MKTKVVNKKHSEYDVYIGRGSEWGNPFIIGKDGTREEVIEKYRERLEAAILSDPTFILKLEQLKGKRLGCFCKPKACHGDVLVEKIEELF